MSSSSNAADAAASSNGNETMLLHIRLGSGTRFDLQVAALSHPLGPTVAEIKAQLAETPECRDCPASRQRLVYKGRILEGDRRLSDYGIVHRSTLFLVKGKPEAAAPPPAAPPSQAAPSQAAPTPVPARTPVPPTPPAPTMQPPAGPANMLQHPAMQGLLEQPELLRNLMQQQMEANPAVQQMMQANPAVRQVLQDPAAWEQAMQMMRNPSAMQQMMRQQDLQLSQLENLPGGMAALQNMYQDFAEPLNDAMSSSGSSSSATSRPSSGSTPGATGQAMPNPWASPAPAPSFSPAPAAASANPFAAAMASMGGTTNDTPAMPGFPIMPPGGGAPSSQQQQQVMQMLDNPAMQSALQTTYRANPDFFRRALFAQNPQMAAMFPNDAAADQFIQSMMDPSVLRAAMQMQQGGNMPDFANIMPQGGNMPDFASFMQSMQGGATPGAAASTPPGGLDFASLLSGAGGAAPGVGAAPPGGLDFGSFLNSMQQQGAGGAAPGGLDFGSFLNSMQQGNNATTPRASAPNPWMTPASSAPTTAVAADRLTPQLRSLYDMGFDDEQRNLTALQMAHGNLNRAVDLLVAGEVPVSVPAPAAPAPDVEAPAPPPKDEEDKKKD